MDKNTNLENETAEERMARYREAMAAYSQDKEPRVNEKVVSATSPANTVSYKIEAGVQEEPVKPDSEVVEPPVDNRMPLRDVMEAQLITMMRVYDTMMAVLMETDEDKAKKLMQLHANGDMMMNAPASSGVFQADIP